jgi:hypothetical protein
VKFDASAPSTMEPQQFVFQPRSSIELRVAIYNYLNGNTVNYPPIGTWDVGLISDMDNLFLDYAKFNECICDWDVSNVRSMASMFRGCAKFNCNLGTWNVSQLTNATRMFEGCSSFTGDGIDLWRPSKLRHARSMFTNCRSLTANLADWSPNLIDVVGMFEGCILFNCNLRSWSSSTESSDMFYRSGMLNHYLPLWFKPTYNRSYPARHQYFYEQCLAEITNIGYYPPRVHSALPHGGQLFRESMAIST